MPALACPVSRGPLLYVPAEGGEPECLLSVQGRRRYPIDGGVAVLLAAESTPLSELELQRLRRRAEIAGSGQL